MRNKLKNSKCDKTQVVTKLKNSNCDITKKNQIVTKLEIWQNSIKKKKNFKKSFSKNILTPWQPMRCFLGSVLRFWRCFSIVYFFEMWKYLRLDSGNTIKYQPLLFIVSRPEKSQRLLYKHLCHSFSDPLVPTTLRCHHAQRVKDSSSSYKIDYVIVIKKFINPIGHQNCMAGLKVMSILLKW